MAGTWSVQVNDLQVGQFLRNSGQRLKSKGGAVCSLGSTGGVDTAYGLFIWSQTGNHYGSLSDNRRSTPVADYQMVQTSDRKPVGLPFRLKRQVQGQRLEGNAEDFYKGYM